MITAFSRHPRCLTDKDIEWIKTIMPDIEFDDCRINILKNMSGTDVHACPGSGKTILSQIYYSTYVQSRNLYPRYSPEYCSS